jgi:hypothetical protein
MKKLLIASMLVGIGAASVSVMAQDKPAGMTGGAASAPAAKKADAKQGRADWEAAFKKADTDGSGGLSKAELEKTDAKAFPAIKKNFDAMDANKDGQVTMAERDAFGKAKKKEKAEKPAAK